MTHSDTFCILGMRPFTGSTIQAYKGTAMGRKIGNDRYEWRIIGKLANGDDYTETGTATRKREAP